MTIIVKINISKIKKNFNFFRIGFFLKNVDSEKWFADSYLAY